jgi:hypothetical protein
VLGSEYLSAISRVFFQCDSERLNSTRTHAQATALLRVLLRTRHGELDAFRRKQAFGNVRNVLLVVGRHCCVVVRGRVELLGGVGDEDALFGKQSQPSSAGALVLKRR